MDRRNSDSWRADIDALAAANDWTVQWDDQALIVNGDAQWTWRPLSDARSGQTPADKWVGRVADEHVVIWVAQGSNTGVAVEGPLGRQRGISG